MRFRRFLTAGAALVAALTGSLVAAQPAAAKDYSAYWIVRDAGTIDGTLIWHNQSVQVGGRLEADDECVAVVYSVYAGDRLLDRAARPGDREYLCDGALGHGFVLQADVTGGATHVYIDLWRHPKGSDRYVRSGHVICYRAWSPCTDD